MPFPPMFSPRYQAQVFLGVAFPSLAGFTEEDVARVSPITSKLAAGLDEFGYMHLQSTRPDTIGRVQTWSKLASSPYIK